MRDALHRAIHRIPGVPAHVDKPRGHQGRTLRSRPRWRHQPWRHQHKVRQPKVLVAWQRRIGRFFGQELP